MQTITRKGSFDAGHRVMNERMKCFNVHGHTYLYELNFEFTEMEPIGYPIDFKEIKRVGCQWIDDMLDHGMILNPHDTLLIDTTKALDSKLWLMSLNGDDYCNPTAENLAREICLAMETLFATYRSLHIRSVRLYETPNCYTDCFADSIPDRDRYNFSVKNHDAITQYAADKGILSYDDRIQQLTMEDFNEPITCSSSN